MQANESLRDVLSKSLLEDLTRLAGNRQHLATIAESISTLAPRIGLHDAADLIAEKTSSSPKDVYRILWIISSLNQLADFLHIPPVELPEMLVVALEKYAPAKWKDGSLEAWKQASPGVAAFLGSTQT